MAIIKYVFSLVGIGMLIGTFFWYQNVVSFIDKSDIGRGKVIELVRSRSGDSTTYKPVVQFYTKNGELIEFMSSMGSSPPSYDVGEQVEVFYLPENPQKAKINGFFSLWGGPLIVGILGGSFFLVGMGILVFSANKSRRDEYLRKHGTPVVTKFQSVEKNRSLSAKGRSPYRIITQWQNPVTSELHVFESNNVWFDPTDYIKDKNITVFIDKKNPKKYCVDLSFLPKAAV